MQAAIAPAPQKYVERLDAVRGVAILWVMLFHFCGAIWGWEDHLWPARFAEVSVWFRLPGQALACLVGRGRLGVPIFFVLSGFLIHLTWCRSTNRDVRLFWWRRWSRIVPPYLAALVVFTLWFDTLAQRHGWSHFLTHLFLVHNYGDQTFFSINGSFWSLAIEAQFYLFYPLLWRLRQAVGMGPLLWVAFATRMAFSIAVELNQELFAEHPTLALCVPRLYFEWILGMYVADCLMRGRRAFTCSQGVGWACVVFAAFAPAPGWWQLGVAPAISIATAIWIDRIVHGAKPAMRIERLLVPLGVASYSLYLWHQPIINEVTWRVMQNPWLVQQLSESGRQGVAMVLSLVPALAVGTLMYWLVEVPSQKWGRSVAQRFFPPPRLKANAASLMPPAEAKSPRKAA